MQDFGKMDDDQLLRAAHGLAVEAQAAKAQADEAKREIRRRFHGHRILYSTTTNLQAAISYPRKLHEEKAKALLTEDELARISVVKLDSKLAQERLGSDVFEVISSEATPRLRVQGVAHTGCVCAAPGFRSDERRCDERYHCKGPGQDSRGRGGGDRARLLGHAGRDTRDRQHPSSP